MDSDMAVSKFSEHVHLHRDRKSPVRAQITHCAAIVDLDTVVSRERAFSRSFVRLNRSMLSRDSCFA